MSKENTSAAKTESRAIAVQPWTGKTSALASFPAVTDADEPVIQRWEMPAFNGAHAVNQLNQLPASGFQNQGMGQSGIYNVPTRNTAVLGRFLQGGNAANTAFTMDAYKVRGATYERGHVITRVLGGPGTPQNIVPILDTLNADMYQNVEAPIIAARAGAQKRLFNLRVDVAYGGHDANHDLTTTELAMPDTFTYSLTERHYTGAGASTNAANWQDSGQGNLIPPAHRVKTNDLSQLGPVDDDEETQRGVAITQYEAKTAELQQAMDQANIPVARQANYTGQFDQAYDNVFATDQFRTAFTNVVIDRFKELLQAQLDIVLAAVETERQLIVNRTVAYTQAIQTVVQGVAALLNGVANLETAEAACRQLDDQLQDLFNQSQQIYFMTEVEGDRWISPCELMAEVIYYFDHPESGIETAQDALQRLNAMVVERANLGFVDFYDDVD